MHDAQTYLRELKDRQDILACVHAYCRGVDRLDRDLLLSAYHPDALDDHGIFVGTPAAFADFFFERHTALQHFTSHNITNHVCELDGDVAHAESYYLYFGANQAGNPVSVIAGRYVDRFERRGGRWAIAVRKCLFDVQATADDLPISPAVRAVRAAMGAARDRSDPSYQRPLTIDPARIGQTMPTNS